MKFSYLVIWYHPSSCLVQTVNLSHPFHIHLSTYSLKPSTSESTDIPSSTPTTTSQVQQGAGEASTSTATTSPILQSSENDPPLEIHTDAPELVNDGHHWYEDIENDTLTPNEQHPATSFRDPAAHTKAHQLLKKATTEANSQDVLCSRVLGDIWHLMNQFPIAQAHGLRCPLLGHYGQHSSSTTLKILQHSELSLSQRECRLIMCSGATLPGCCNAYDALFHRLRSSFPALPKSFMSLDPSCAQN